MRLIIHNVLETAYVSFVLQNRSNNFCSITLNTPGSSHHMMSHNILTLLDHSGFSDWFVDHSNKVYVFRPGEVLCVGVDVVVGTYVVDVFGVVVGVVIDVDIILFFIMCYRFMIRLNLIFNKFIENSHTDVLVDKYYYCYFYYYPFVVFIVSIIFINIIFSMLLIIYYYFHIIYLFLKIISHEFLLKHYFILYFHPRF